MSTEENRQAIRSEIAKQRAELGALDRQRAMARAELSRLETERAALDELRPDNRPDSAQDAPRPKRRPRRSPFPALCAEVMRRSGSWQPPEVMRDLDVVAYTRTKVGPMVRGLFPRVEQDLVRSLVERSVVFLTPDNIDAVLHKEMRWPGSAWDIANLYLGGIGAELLSEEAPRLLGLSQETTCYVSPAYFEEEDPLPDFVVHEVAHMFHNCKRHDAGLVATRRREWLLDIAFRKREIFAYACEAYARIIERAKRPSARAALACALGDDFGTDDDRVGPGEVAEVVRQAAARRNGWKVILGMCASTPTGSRGSASPPARSAPD